MGNKCDLAEKRAVSESEVQTFLQNHKEVEYIETSAKTAEHVEEAFHKIAGMLIECSIRNAKSSGKRRTEDGVTKLEGKEQQSRYYCCY